MTKESCAARLQRALILRNMKQTELSQYANIPKSAISQYLSGKFEPKQDRLEILAKVLNVSEAWLMGYDVSIERDHPQKSESSITVLPTKIRMIPLYESVSAGFGTCAIDCVIDYIPLPINSEEEAKETICIKVSGDSMYPKIEDGDIIVVHKQESVDSGRVAVLLVDKEDAIVKKVKYLTGEDWLELVSFNPEYKTRRFEGPDVLRVEVLGLVKQVIKSM